VEETFERNRGTETMKSKEAIETRLKAENAACAADPTLLENDYVQGYMAGLKFVLEDDVK
jgi:hypothetical protein